MRTQKYEKYWSITLAYTDIDSKKFIDTLESIVDFIDSNDVTEYSEELYADLQRKVSKKNGLHGASLRKSINQFVKLGFINFQLKSYHKDCKKFLNAKTNKRRQTVFSKIVYENSSFDRDVTKDSDECEINFLLKTLEEVGKLSKEDIAALMTQDISQIPKGYLSKKELAEAKKNAKEIDFYKRKYNQVGHFNTILKRLDNLRFVSGNLYFEDDARAIFGEETREVGRGRDAYLQRLYKNDLMGESEEIEGKPKCMVEHLDYPSLVASHIKPLIRSNPDEAYDPNNGLLLSRNFDSLFDSGAISFEDDGRILISKELSKPLTDHLMNYKLDKVFINEERMRYLQYHRSTIFKR